MAFKPRNEYRIDLKIWFRDEVWQYQIDVHSRTFDPKADDVQQLTSGFSDDFDALLQEALQQAEEHAEVLRGG